jgi:alkylation response protein AidB-like acyl-CoA dehydrogenase
MDFRPGESQQLLAGIARDFLAKHVPPTLVQELALDPVGFRLDLWSEMSSLGWPGLLVPGALGGGDGTLLDVMVLVEEMGRACLPGPYVHSAVVATSLLLAEASEAQRERLLPPLALGEQRCALAITEESAAFEPAAIALAGEVGGRLNGRKLFVKDAHVADHLLVAARGVAGITLFVVDRARRGIALSPLSAMSGEKLFEVTFHDVATRAADVVGVAGRGWDALAPALRLGALARGAEMVGAAQRILDLCVDYGRVRVQSGRPIGSFQAIQHACADLVRDVDSARALLRAAAWKVESGRDAAADVAMAKAYAGEACLAVARRGHQILGAISFCEEHPLHLLHKRIHAGSLDFGDAAAHYETVARSLGLA